MRTVVILLGAAAALAAAGCDATEWRPPAPSGVTYEYAAQGFTGKSVTAFGAAGGGSIGGGAFAFRERSGVAHGHVKDPFAESTPIDGVRFNEHLAGRGVRVTPDAATPAGAGAGAGKKAGEP
jgi:hypothetical protein